MEKIEVTHLLSRKDLVHVVARLISERGSDFVPESVFEDESGIKRSIRSLLRRRGQTYVSDLRGDPELEQHVSEASEIVDDIFYARRS